MSTLYVDNLQPNLGNAVGAAGHVVQVIQADTNGEIANTSSSFIKMFQGSITPHFATSKVLVHIDFTVNVYWVGSNNDAGAYYRIYRDGVWVDTNNGGQGVRFVHPASVSAGDFTDQIGQFYLDSPATTNTVTYQLYMKVSNPSTANAIISRSVGGDTGIARVTMMEIAQ
jgi:hypothetical protein